MIKRLIALGIALIMLFSFAACGDNSGDDKTTEAPSTTSYIREIKTKVAAVKDVSGFGLSKLAKDRDYAYDVTYYDNVQQVKELIKNGETDFAAMTISDAISLYKEGTDIKIVSVNNFISTFVLTKGVEIKDPSELKGKTIYSVKNDELTEKFIRATMGWNDVDYDSLDIRVFDSVSEIVSETEGKDEYVLMLTGVDASKLPADKDRKTALDLTYGWVNQRKSLPVHTVVVAKSDYIKSNPEMLDEFRMFNEVSVNYIIGNAESGAIHLFENGFFDSAETAMAYVSEYSSLGYAEKEKMQKIVGESLEAYVDNTVSVQDIVCID